MDKKDDRGGLEWYSNQKNEIQNNMPKSHLIKIITKLNLTAIIVLILLVEPANALQSHGYPGLHVHQIAHIFLLLAMIIFAFKVRRSRLGEKKSWRLIAWGAWLFALWNLWAFSGHTLELYIPEDSIAVIPPAKTPSLLLKSWWELLYYVLKMDHLLSIPATVCFYAGLRAMTKDIAEDIRP